MHQFLTRLSTLTVQPDSIAAMDTSTAMPFRTTIGVSYLQPPDPIHQLDLLMPAAPTERFLPVAIRFECPGWKAGPRSAAFDGFANTLLARRGFITIAASIRSSDDAAWPAQLNDAQHVLDWVLSNPLELPLDPERIVVWGQSAGGHIATMLALHNPQSVKAIVAMCTPFDLADRSWTDAQADDSPATDLLGGPEHATITRRQAASPIHHLTADQPPMMIIHGTQDETVPVSQAVRMHDAVRTAGQVSELVTIDGGHHNLLDDPEAPYEAPIWYSVGHQAAEFLSAILVKPTR